MRFSFILRAVFCAALVLALSLPSVSSAKTIFRIGHTGAPADDFTYGIEQFAKELSILTGGEAECKILGNSVLGSDRIMTEMAQQGSLDMCNIGQSQIGLFIPTLIAMDIPFITDHTKNRQFLEAFNPGGPLYEYVDAQASRIGLKLIMLLDTPFRGYAFAPRVKISDLESLKGMKVRVTMSAVEQAFVNALGMNPCPMTQGEVYTALHQGTVDGEIINLASFNSWNRFEVEDKVYMTLHNQAKMFIVMSKLRFDALSPEMRKNIIEAGRIAQQKEWDRSAELEAAAAEQCRARGIALLPVSETDRARLHELTAPLYERFSEEIDPNFVELIRSVQK